MNTKISNNYLWLCALILVIALGIDYVSSSVGFIIKELSVIESGAIEKKSIVAYPFYANILKLISAFLYTLTAAIFISIFVTKRMERAREIEHRKEIVKLQEAVNVDVFDALFKKLVPEELFVAIKDGIINNKIVRKNAQWLYDFEVKGDSITLRQTIKYEMHNLSHDQVVDPVCLEYDKLPASSYVLTKAISSIDGVQNIKFDLENVDECKGLEQIVDGDCNFIKFNIIIPPNKYADVTMVFDLLYDHTPINDSFFTNHSVIDATLIATYPGEYDFNIFQALSSELVCTLEEKNRKIYEAKGGILPNQGYIFKLSKRSKKE